MVLVKKEKNKVQFDVVKSYTRVKRVFDGFKVNEACLQKWKSTLYIITTYDASKMMMMKDGEREIRKK